MKFRTIQSDRVRVPSASGNTVRFEYIEKFDRNGRPYLEVTKEIDINDEINADADSCKLSNIVQRYLFGDRTALEQRPAVYADFSNAPTSLIDAYNLLADASNKFSSLQKEVKANYNNNFMEFLASFDKPSPKEVSDDVEHTE